MEISLNTLLDFNLACHGPAPAHCHRVWGRDLCVTEREQPTSLGGLGSRDPTHVIRGVIESLSVTKLLYHTITLVVCVGQPYIYKLP
jgi:hypothetical protein